MVRKDDCGPYSDRTLPDPFIAMDGLYRAISMVQPPATAGIKAMRSLALTSSSGFT
jgi:hypothetical protein